jgi:transcriptional regulator with AAA-type ATPase domain
MNTKMNPKKLDTLRELQKLQLVLTAIKPTSGHKMHQALNSLVRRAIAQHRSGAKVDMDELYKKIQDFQSRHNDKSSAKEGSRKDAVAQEIDGHELVGEAVDSKPEKVKNTNSSKKTKKNSVKKTTTKQKNGVKKDEK